MIKITNEFLEKGKSIKGGWSSAQFRSLGVSSFKKGWKRKLIGTDVTEEQADKFINLKDAHIGKREENKRKREETRNGSYTVSVYQEKEWIDVRQKVLDRDNGRCVNCGSSKNLRVHHLIYERGKEIWAIPLWYMVTLCDNCHKIEHSKDFISPTKIFEFKKR